MATPRGIHTWGHALLILLGEGEDMLVDSEVLESCFNIWYQPESWKGFTAFEKMVSGWVAKGENPLHVGIWTIPMGYRGAVDLAQNPIRNLVFGAARIPRSIAVQKDSRFPDGARLRLRGS